MYQHEELTDAEVITLIRRGAIRLAGNRRLQIYGRLDCRSGKRMKRDNRVFFEDEAEARRLGYRPCGHCMKSACRLWKDNAACP